MKIILLLCSILFASLHSLAQVTDEYRSIQSGVWSDPATWEVFDGTSWQPASSIPSTHLVPIRIQTTHTVNIDVPASLIPVATYIIETGGNLTGELVLDYAYRLGSNVPDFIVDGTAETIRVIDYRFSNGISGNGTIGTLEVNLSSPGSGFSNYFSFYGNLKISSSCTISVRGGGRHVSISNSLTILQGAVFGTNAVITSGRLKRYIDSGGNAAYPFGFVYAVPGPIPMSKSLQVSIELSPASNGDYYSVEIKDDYVYNNYDSDDNHIGGIRIDQNVIRKVWSIKEDIQGGSDATLTVKWEAGDENTGFDPNLSRIVHFENGEWDFPTSAGSVTSETSNDRTISTISRSAITSFSPFSVASSAIVAPMITFYRDFDEDNYGDAGNILEATSQPPGYVSDNTDCNDADAAINPGATEICGNGIDENCIGGVENVCDTDADGISDATDNCPAIYNPDQLDSDADGQGNECDEDDDNDGIPDTTDCDPVNPAINLNATEICGNGIDENCNGMADDICPPVDTDGDGLADTNDNCPNTSNTNQLDTDGDGQGNVCDEDDDNDGTADTNDCSPLNQSIHAGANEICGNGIDENCNGNYDDVCDMDGDGVPDANDNCPTISITNQLDTDNDGQGNVCDIDDDNDGTADANDCAPLNAAIRPGAAEICGNNIDDDCDGATDEGCTVANLPRMTITGSLVTEGNSGIRTITFLITLNKKSNIPVTAQYQTANNTAIASQDYVQKNGTVSFPANSLLQTLTVQVKGDVLNETNENFMVLLSDPVNATLTNNNAPGYILNDDPVPAVRVSDVTTTESSQQVLVKISLTKPSGQLITVKFDTKDGSARAPGDYTAIANGSIIFLPGETEKFVTVVIKYNNNSESTEKFELRLKDAINGSLSSEDGARKTATISIQNSTQVLTKEMVVNNETTASIQIPGLLRKYQQLKINVVRGPIKELVIVDSKGAVIARIDQYAGNWAPGNIPSGIYFCKIGIRDINGHYKVITGKIMITD